MAHPQMFDDDDPMLARVRELALGMPGADEKVSHGRPVFFTTKIFCMYGGSRKVDGQWIQHDQAIQVMPDELDRRPLLERAEVWVPGYTGPSGWLGIDLSADTDWDEVAELVDMSFRLTAPTKLVAQLPALPTTSEEHT